MISTIKKAKKAKYIVLAVVVALHLFFVWKAKSASCKKESPYTTCHQLLAKNRSITYWKRKVKIRRASIGRQRDLSDPSRDEILTLTFQIRGKGSIDSSRFEAKLLLYDREGKLDEVLTPEEYDIQSYRQGEIPFGENASRDIPYNTPIKAQFVLPDDFKKRGGPPAAVIVIVDGEIETAKCIAGKFDLRQLKDEHGDPLPIDFTTGGSVFS